MKTIDEMEMPAPDTIVNCKNGGPIAAMFFYAAAEQDLGEIASEHGFETRVTTMESDCENLQERWEEGSGDMAALMDEWQPATPEGWMLTLWGNAIGFVFALVTLCATVIAFPLLIDRDTGVTVAIVTSVRAVAANPVPMAIWGLLVAFGLVIGSIPLFVGLAVVMPVFGHATWHLYRKVIAPAE